MGVPSDRYTAVLTISACTPEAAALMHSSQDLALHGSLVDATGANPSDSDQSPPSTYAAGNELLCFFNSADAGFRSAYSYRQRVQDHSRIPVAFHVRMLLDCPAAGAEPGYATKRKMVTTRQLVRRLPADRIFATESGVQRLSAAVRGSFAPAEDTLFGVLPGEALYCAAIEQDDASTRLSIAARNDNGDTQGKTLHLRWRDRKLTLRPESPPITFGRSGDADIQLVSDLTSRIHAQLSFQKTDFILSDQSTNGTFVKIGDGEEVTLHHRQIVLRDTGVISLGSRVRGGRGNLVYFSIG